MSGNPMQRQEPRSLGNVLKHWREVNRLSQMALAAEAGVSTRHLSFVETGKAQPSRDLLLRLANVLQLTLRQTNGLLLAAGYAPAYSKRPLSTPQMNIVQETLRRMLEKHDPYPALVVNEGYDILTCNQGYERVVAVFAGADALRRHGNVYRLVFAVDGLRPYFQNWPFISQALLSRLLDEANASQSGALFALLAELQTTVTPSENGVEAPQHDLPVLTFTLQKADLALRFFSTLTTFGTPLDVNVQEMRIESLFPADANTQKWLESARDYGDGGDFVAK